MASRVEKERRVIECMEMMLAGSLTKDLYVHFETQYGIKTAQVDKYIRQAKDEIKLKYNVKKDEIIDFHEGQLRLLYKRAMEKRDFKLAKEVLKEIAILQGLNSPEEHTHIMKDVKDILDDIIKPGKEIEEEN